MLLGNEIPSDYSREKMKNLFLGLLFDGIGMLSFTVIGIGEFSDVIWAPIAAYLMAKMYKGIPGKIAGGFAFLEEIIPFTDFIPSFTMMWIYNYLLKKQPQEVS
ncbi:MAG TPA: hypothetical protein VK528_14160 [Flavobacterium sp.]|nr:hypothetical protein [Flavobacterium sp.]